jgi:hypothetical protein
VVDVDPVGLVVEVDKAGTVVAGNDGRVVGVARVELNRSLRRATIELGLGMLAPDGTKATVMSCPSTSFTVPGS